MFLMPLTLALIEYWLGRDPLFHLRRAEAGVAPDHRHHRNPDLREDVGAHHVAGDGAEEHNQGGHDIERV
jgi:hypothetical protein